MLTLLFKPYSWLIAHALTDRLTLMSHDTKFLRYDCKPQIPDNLHPETVYFANPCANLGDYLCDVAPRS